MGIGDFVNKDLLDKAVDAIHDNEEKVDQAIDKAAAFVESKTPDNVDGMVRQAADKAKDFT